MIENSDIKVRKFICVCCGKITPASSFNYIIEKKKTCAECRSIVELGKANPVGSQTIIVEKKFKYTPLRPDGVIPNNIQSLRREKPKKKKKRRR